MHKKKEYKCCGGYHVKDKLDATIWAVVFIWAGFVMLMNSTGLQMKVIWWNSWSIFFIGVGVIVLIGTVIRLLIPKYRNKSITGIFIGLILLGVGLQTLLNLALFWPIVFVVIGFYILFKVFYFKEQ
jgi:hypothetical protein